LGTISVSLPSDGTTADVADYNTPITTIVTVINGNLDNDNIASAAAIAGSKLADASIANAKLTNQAWSTWPPSWTNFTVGNGTLNYAKYTQVGKTVVLRLKFTLGSTSSVSGAITFSLPVNLNADYADDSHPLIHDVRIRDTGTAYFKGGAIVASSSTVSLIAKTASGTYVGEAATSSTVPMTWTTNDAFSVGLIYEGV